MPYPGYGWYCSPGTRCAPPPGEEHGVAEFPEAMLHICPGYRVACNRRKKKPVLAYELFFKYGGEGGIDSLRSPLLGPSLGLAPAGPAQALFKIAPGNFVGADSSQARHLSNWLSPVVEPRSGLLIPPAGCYMRKKSPYSRTSSSSNMAVRGGLTRCARRYSARPWASPLRGQRKRCSKLLPAILSGQIPRRLVICPTGCRQLSNPGRGFSSPRRGAICEKKARTCVRALLKIWR